MMRYRAIGGLQTPLAPPARGLYWRYAFCRQIVDKLSTNCRQMICFVYNRRNGDMAIGSDMMRYMATFSAEGRLSVYIFPILGIGRRCVPYAESLLSGVLSGLWTGGCEIPKNDARTGPRGTRFLSEKPASLTRQARAGIPSGPRT